MKKATPLNSKAVENTESAPDLSILPAYLLTSGNLKEFKSKDFKKK
jgi:hypothetical protein